MFTPLPNRFDDEAAIAAQFALRREIVERNLAALRQERRQAIAEILVAVQEASHSSGREMISQ
jgi:hypothetical protein